MYFSILLSYFNISTHIKHDIVHKSSFLNKYENLSSQLSAQGVTIEDELNALVLMSNMPPSWETYVTTVCNASKMIINYSKSKSLILTKDVGRRSFVHDSAKDTFVVQISSDRSNNGGRCSFGN